MLNRIWLITVLLIVPLCGYIVSTWIQEDYDEELRSAIMEHIPDADELIVQEMTLNALCDDPDTELEEVCFSYNTLGLMRDSAILAAIVGIVLILVTKIAGLIARTNRRILLFVFKPGLHLTAIILIGLVVVACIDCDWVDLVLLHVGGTDLLKDDYRSHFYRSRCISGSIDSC